MRPFIVATALVFMIALSVAAAPHSSPAGETRQALQAAYKGWDAAWNHHDADSVTKYFDAYFTAIGQQGQKQTLAELLTALPGMMTSLHNERMDTTIQQLAVRNDGIVATVLAHSQQTRVRPSDGHAVHEDTVETRRDFWVKTDQGWKIKQSRSLSSLVKIDGKRVQQKGDAPAASK